MRGRRPGPEGGDPRSQSGPLPPPALWKAEEVPPSGLRPEDGSRSSASRKEVIQPQVPLRLPCYDFTPVADPTVVGCPPEPKPRVGAPPSGRTNSHGVTGGVYKARERIHRGVLIRDY
jgi:hypothetical protein